MKQMLIIALCLSCFLRADEALDLGKLSRALGHVLFSNVQEAGLDYDSVVQGMQDARAQKPSPLAQEAYEQQMVLLQAKLFQDTAAKNLLEAEAFLTKNSKETGVVEILANKLQYKIVVEGSGSSVAPTNAPLLFYKGAFVDGTLFGQTQDQPISLPLDQTIPGFSQGIAGMKEGETRMLYIHPDLAYGTSGQLPPNKCLIFEIRVVQADSKEKTPS